MTNLNNLTKVELRLFNSLMDQEVASTDGLMVDVWGFPEDIRIKDTTRVRMTVSRLRSKLEGSPFEIETVRGVGFRLVVR